MTIALPRNWNTSPRLLDEFRRPDVDFDRAAAMQFRFTHGSGKTDGGYLRLCVDGPVVRGDQITTAMAGEAA